MDKVDKSAIKLAERYKIDIDDFDSVWDATAELNARADYVAATLMKLYNEKSIYCPQTEVAIDNWESGEENSVIDYFLDEYIKSNTKQPLDRNSTLGIGDVTELAEAAKATTSTTSEMAKAMKKLQSNVLLDPNEAKVARIKELADQLAATYARKNKDYGDSFGISVARYGIIAALTRMSDKWNRLENLILNEGQHEVKDESVLDTLLDLATYALMTYMEVENGNM